MSNPYSVDRQLDAATGITTFWLKLDRPIPDSWSLDIGDILFNLRSSLDHIAFELATKHLERTLSESEARSCYFPIFRERPSAKKWNSSVKLFGDSVQKKLEEMQPYHHQDPDAQYLGFLNKYCNIDKHRSIHIALTAIHDFKIGPPYKVIMNIKKDSLVQDGDEIGRATLRLKKIKAPIEVTMDLLIGECFSETIGGQAVPIDQGLRLCHKHLVWEVVPALRPFLN